MLNLSLTAVSRGQVEIEGAIAPDDPIWEGTGLAFTQPVTTELVAQSVGEGILVRGTIHAELAQECRRCLGDVRQTVNDSIDLLFEPLTGEEREALSGEVYPLPDRGDQVDLRPALREQLLLRVPEFVVCDDACKGLCPSCGGDLNRSRCDCGRTDGPSAWDALKKLDFE